MVIVPAYLLFLVDLYSLKLCICFVLTDQLGVERVICRILWSALPYQDVIRNFRLYLAEHSVGNFLNQVFLLWRAFDIFCSCTEILFLAQRCFLLEGLLCLKIHDSALQLILLYDLTINCLLTIHTFRTLLTKLKGVLFIVLKWHELLAFDLLEYRRRRMQALISIACSALVERYLAEIAQTLMAFLFLSRLVEIPIHGACFVDFFWHFNHVLAEFVVLNLNWLLEFE